MSDYSKDFQAGTLKGAQGTIPGTFAKEDFKKKLLAIDPAGRITATRASPMTP